MSTVDFDESAGQGTRWGPGPALTGGIACGEIWTRTATGEKLLERVGWEIYLGGDQDGGERREPITRVRVAGDQVRITAADGVTYVTGYVDAVRCRRPT